MKRGILTVLAATAASVACGAPDPTRPLTAPPANHSAAAEPSTGQPRVASVLITQGRHVAIIDTEIVGPGDRVGPYRVESIDHDGVWLVAGDGGRVRIGLDLPTMDRLMSDL